MRITTPQDPNAKFRVKAYAGTNGVLLAFDVDKSDKKDLLGFAIEEKLPSGIWRFKLNSLTFPGKEHTVKKYNATPTDIAPIQKFRWADYDAPSNTDCAYRIYPVYKGKLPVKSGKGDFLEVKVKTDDGKPKGHQVIFNRAVVSSQGFDRRFPMVGPLVKKNKKASVMDWPKAAGEWLHNGLLDRLNDFIVRAQDKTWALDVAIYEYELPAIVMAVNAAHKRKANVRVLYHAKPGDKQTPANKHSLKELPAACQKGRVPSKLFHNKYIVLSKLVGGKRQPQAVLCGSTNFTENGVYRQANVIHIIDDKKVAAKYLELFDLTWENPKGSAARDWINEHNTIDEKAPLFVGFSPRTGGGDLDAIVRLIQTADTDLLFCTAFGLPPKILNALRGKDNDPVLRYGLQNTASEITGYHGDKTGKFVATASLGKGIDGWTPEDLKGQQGSLRVHLKAVVANFTTDHPVVLSGSHNLSASASSGNDENYLIIRGDTDLADRYGIELMRFYEHYRYRWAQKQKGAQKPELTNSDKWLKDYYDPKHLKYKARLRYVGR
ncbi:MAG: phospholipase [Flavobacteriales bacterium]|nr:phospholipase [Flavobacteriales bacterium]